MTVLLVFGLYITAAIFIGRFYHSTHSWTEFMAVEAIFAGIAWPIYLTYKLIELIIKLIVALADFASIPFRK